MADRYYATLGRDGLASCYSYLDGVPFKIGPAFKQPAKIDVLPEYAKVTKQRNTYLEYSFETEEGVLAWAKAKEEAAQQKAKEEAERAKQESELEKEAAQIARQADAARQQFEAQVEAANENEADQEGDNFPEDPVAPLPLSVDTTQVGQPKPPVPRRPPAVPSRPTTESNLILKPTQFQSGGKAEPFSQSNEAQVFGSSVDVSMFEQEADPFENLSLQTINDMEELKAVLDVRPTPAPRKHINVSQSLTKDSSKPSDADNIESATTNNWVTFDDGDKMTKQNNSGFSETSGNGQCNQSPRTACQPAQYQPVALSNGVSLTSNVPASDASQKLLGGMLPPSLANTRLYKPVLPPIPGHPHINGGKSFEDKEQTQQNGISPYISQSVQPSNLYVSGDPPVSLPSSTSQSNPFTAESSSFPTSLLNRPLPTPPVVAPKPTTRSDGNSRMWSSMGPSAFIGSIDDGQPIPQLRNSSSRHSASTTDLTGRDADSRNYPINEPRLSSSPQAFNQLRPLPPTPKPAPSTSLSDPYSSLTRDQQNFTDSLSSMGFLRARVARAVKNFGQDEALDHLLAVDKLIEKRFSPLNVETALRIFKNDVEKSEKYLTMLTQFEGLGFQRDLVQDALVTADMDHDKTLDLLTA